MEGFWYRIRIPIMALGMFSLILGIWSGLLRAGWNLAEMHRNLAALHGPLMVCGFVGTVIGLERAVALGAKWGFFMPFLSAAGALTALAGFERAGALLIILSSAGLVAMYLVILKKQLTLFNLVMGTGAVLWVVGSLFWYSGDPLFNVVPWWACFLVLTVAGERLELSRFLNHPPAVQGIFAASGILTIIGAAASSSGYGSSVLGVGLMFLALWLAMFDVARRTLFQKELIRYVAACLLSGYFWLMVSGAVFMHQRMLMPGYEYDAALHALFLGFVFSMIFGHAPIIFPAVLRVLVPYRPAFYAHFALLQLSMVIRVAGDLAGHDPMRKAGAMLNAAALILFLANTVISVKQGLASAK